MSKIVIKRKPCIAMRIGHITIIKTMVEGAILTDEIATEIMIAIVVVTAQEIAGTAIGLAMTIEGTEIGTLIDARTIAGELSCSFRSVQDDRACLHRSQYICNPEKFSNIFLVFPFVFPLFGRFIDSLTSLLSVVTKIDFINSK